MTQEGSQLLVASVQSELQVLAEPWFDMKISALLLLLLAAAWVGSQGMSFRSRSQCCSREMFSTRKIPELLIQDYQHTDPSCSHRAVLVKLQKGMVCVDPEKKWFQKFLRKQKQPNSTSR